MRCGDCTCNIDFSDACARCPKGNWDQTLCVALVGSDAQALKTPPTLPQDPKHKDKETPTLPSTATMAKSALKAVAKWTLNGVKMTDPETLTNRLDLCRACDFWNAKYFNNTGRCMKCGCSTWAKLRMSTEKCPIGKW